MNESTVTTPTGETEPINEQEQRIRVKTIFENDDWKYVWPINDYSFCQLAKGTEWCSDGVKSFEGYGTSYILQSKDTGEMWKFDDREKFINRKGKNDNVIGGGDTLMDCNRTTVRQGAKSVRCR